ncbi:MAG TPA: SCO family protein [Kofleriaceae bacterium]|nr:SCO family protein [Kofleriaceae bacterium]
MPPLTRSVAVPGRRLLVALVVVFAAAVVPAVLVPTLMCRRADPVLDDLGPVGSFALTDERGQPFTEDALRGHVTLVSFLFTRCDTICPVTTMKMARLQDKTFDAGAHIKLASFSVDPEYDTPARLAEYAKHYQADPARWRFVTGGVEQMRALVEGPLMNSMQKKGVTASGAPDITHQGYFLLVDGTGHLRGIYDSNDIHKLDEMVRDARFLVRTSPASRQ